jgi:hypothetical protein
VSDHINDHSVAVATDHSDTRNAIARAATRPQWIALRKEARQPTS